MQPNWAGRYHVPRRLARKYISGCPRLSFLSSFLTTPFGSQIVTRISGLSLNIPRSLPGPSQSFLCVSLLSDTHFVTRSSKNYPTVPIIPNLQRQGTHYITAAMFKRSFRTNDRIDKVVKLKKAYRDPAKLSRLQKSFDQIPPVGR